MSNHPASIPERTGDCSRHDGAGTRYFHQHYEVRSSGSTIELDVMIQASESTGYTRPRPGFAIYNASKAAVTVRAGNPAIEPPKTEKVL